jgi:hypothetical protein
MRIVGGVCLRAAAIVAAVWVSPFLAAAEPAAGRGPGKPASPAARQRSSPTLNPRTPSVHRSRPSQPRSRTASPVIVRPPADPRHTVGPGDGAPGRLWQPDAACLAFGGSPDINRNGIPDFVYAVASGAFVPNPAEPDADRDGVMDAWQQDADADGRPDADAYLDVRMRVFATAGIDPQADDDGDGIPNETDEWLADFDGDGIVNFNDATPCGGSRAAPASAVLPVDPQPQPPSVPPLVSAPPPVPVTSIVDDAPLAPPGPIALVDAGVPLQPAAAEVVVGADLPVADGPPMPTLVPPLDQPRVFDRALLAAVSGDVDVDSDNTNPGREPDHGASEERSEDDGEGVVVEASGPDVRITVPLDVQLRVVTAATRIRFKSATGVFAIYGGDPVRRSWVPLVQFGDEYGATESGFMAGRYRRFHVEALRAGGDAITVEVDPAGDGAWSVVDGVVLTGRLAGEPGALAGGPAGRR